MHIYRVEVYFSGRTSERPIKGWSIVDRVETSSEAVNVMLAWFAKGYRARIEVRHEA